MEKQVLELLNLAGKASFIYPNTEKIVEKYDIPFKNGKGELYFPYKPLRDLVFIWFKRPSKGVFKKGSLYIPERADETINKTKQGVVLAISSFYLDKKGRKREIEIKPGDEIIYDNQTPWFQKFVAPNGQSYSIKYMGYQDIVAIVN